MDGELRLIFKVDGRYHPVDLCHKAVEFGPVRVRHVWADVRTLYRPGRAANSDAVVGYFWGLCRTRGTAGDPGPQASYLLARLLPLARAVGARRVVPDGRFGPPRCRAYAGVWAAAVADLEALLVADRAAGAAAGGMTRLAFRDRTAGLLGIPDPDAPTLARYHALCDELFGPARAVVADDPERAVGLVRDRWRRATRAWGRRGGHGPEKAAMDYLSYECRAAFHRCYAAFWLDALGPLAAHFGPADADVRFWHLWHLDHASDGADGPDGADGADGAAAGTDRPFHWFHGHVPALHPAGALLAGSAAGRVVLGAYLSAAGEGERASAFGRLLGALHHAVYVYADHRDTVRQARRAGP